MTPRLLILLFLFQSAIIFGQNNTSSTHKNTKQSDELFLNFDNRFRQKHSEKKINELKNRYAKQMANGDTLKAINTISNLGNIYANHASYSLAYQQFWNALLLADEINDTETTARALEDLAWLYISFQRKEEAIKYFESSLRIKKDLITKGELSKKNLSPNYYGLTTLYRETHEPLKSKAYLDSCYMIHYSGGESTQVKPFLQAEEYYYQLSRNHYNEAITNMLSIEPWFKINQPDYLVMLYSFLGDAYKKTKKYKKSEHYYKMSITISENYKSHMNYIPRVYEQLSELYLSMGDYKNAHDKLQEAKKLNEHLFDSRSENNKALFEVNDEFRKVKEAQNKLIQKQRLSQLEQEDRIWFLQKLILIGTFIIIIVFVLFYIKHLKTRHKTQQNLARKERELENKKNTELVELKNKELAISALQLIEKDELLKHLKTSLTNQPTPPTDSEVNKLFKSISLSNAQNWKQFEARFKSVNQEFFKTLVNTYPKLTAGDRRLCALVRLNFSSKDIAKLMGISNESVHTLRYRLRKKMGLARADNLFKHLEQFG
nr:tetratricopeptide repeat protein [uncultured Marinifilum sp.]